MKTWLCSNFIYWLARALSATLRLDLIGEERIEEMRSRYGGAILVTWHGRTVVPIVHYRGRGYWAMISTSRDGNIQNRLFCRFGFRTVRGSSSARGAVAAAHKMAKELRSGAVLVHTPDGPRGPSHSVHPGAIFLAEKSGCPIIPGGVSAGPAIVLRTWDRFLIPKPFARATIVLGEPMLVPPKLSEEAREEFCRRLGAEISRLEAEADALMRPVKPAAAAAETRSS